MDDETALYIVQLGDTLERIAARANVTPGLIKSMNRLSDRNVYAGQAIKLPVPPELLSPKADVTIAKLESPVLCTNSSPTPVDQSDTQKVLKIKSKHFTKSDGTVGGMLLITPNSVMFDPDLMHPLIVEKGPADYTVTAPLGALVSLAMYANLPLDPVDDVARDLGLKTDNTMKTVQQSPDSDFSSPTTIRGDSDANSIYIPEISVIEIETLRKVQFTLFDEKMPSTLSPASADESVSDTFSQCPSLDRLATTLSTSESPLSPQDTEIPVLINRSFKHANSSSDNDISKKLPEIENSRRRVSENLTANEEIVRHVEKMKIDKSIATKMKRNETIERLFEKTKELRHQIKITNVLEDHDTILKSSSKNNYNNDNGRSLLPYYLRVSVDNTFGKNLKKSPSPRSDQTHKKSEISSNSDKKEPINGTSVEPINKFSNYWFTVPKQRVEDLYAFLLHFLPEKFNKRQRHASNTSITSANNGNPSTNTLQADLFGFVLLQKEDNLTPDSRKPDDNANELFSTPETMLNLNQQWEIVTVEEVKRRMSILDLFKEPEFYTLPDGSDHPLSLNDEMIDQLIRVLPARSQVYPWIMVYSSDTDGFSLSTLYRNMSSAADWSPSILVVTDTERNVFGAVLSCPIRLQDSFSTCYGTGESFLFAFRRKTPQGLTSSLEEPKYIVINDNAAKNQHKSESAAALSSPRPENSSETLLLEHYPWTGLNTCIANAQPHSLAIGAGGQGLGLHLDSDLNRGASMRCETFDNKPLAGNDPCKHDFFVWRVEAFVFGMDRLKTLP